MRKHNVIWLLFSHAYVSPLVTPLVFSEVGRIKVDKRQVKRKVDEGSQDCYSREERRTEGENNSHANVVGEWKIVCASAPEEGAVLIGHARRGARGGLECVRERS